MSERTILYARVSTDEQAEQGNGISYQRSRCLEYAERRGYAVVKELTDDYTGRVALRPGTTELLDLIRPLGVTVIVVHRTDRLGRHASVQEVLEAEIEARGARVEYVSATYDRSTASGRAMRRVQGVFDQLDYENTVDRLKEHKVEAVRRGSIVNTRPPYGYRKVARRGDDGRRSTHLEIEETEAEIVRLIFAWYTSGDETGRLLSIKAIVIKLNAMGAHRRPGIGRSKGRWGAATVFDLLHRETYIGRWYYNRTVMVRDPGTNVTRQLPRPAEDWIRVDVPPIISEDVFQQVQARAQLNLERAARNRKRTYLFSGMIRCTTCGQRMAGRTNSGSGGSRFYRCGDRSHVETLSGVCPPLDYNEAAIDRVVWSWITDLANHPDRIEATLQQRHADLEQQNARLAAHAVTIERLITQKEHEQANLIRLYAKTPITALEAEIDQFQREIETHRQEHARTLAQLDRSSYSPAQVAQIKDVCAIIAQALPYFTVEDKRQTYELFEFTGRVAVEDGWQVIYAECVLSLDVARLPLAEQRDGADRAITFGLSRSVAPPGP